MPKATPDHPRLIVQTLPERFVNDPLRLFFGGSFDPPHLGHTALPQAVLSRLGYPNAPVVYVPAARSPHKADNPTPAMHRVSMLQLALHEAPNALIWSEELDRANRTPDEPSYWAITWELVRQLYPDDRNRFLIGADQATSMHRWRNYQSFWKDALVMLRDEHDDPAQMVAALRSLEVWSEQELQRWSEMICPVPLLNASSTSVRSDLADPTRRKNPIAGLDDRVREYIVEHGLYRS